MARLTTADEIPSGPASVGDTRPSIWAAIHPRLLELIRAHRSTLIFVNSRRLAERLAGALNELAGETLVRSHHGSIAREQRVEIEDLLKAGSLRALVATSSLELGIDMGAIDLVVQIEAPPSVASGLQRIGRGGHQVDAVSEGVIFPKFRGDLVACAAVTRAMHDGDGRGDPLPAQPARRRSRSRSSRWSAMDTWDVDELFDAVRRAAPFAELSRERLRRRAGHAVGALSLGRVRRAAAAHHLGPRRAARIARREGAKRVAVINGGTIPDRGLYGVFLVGARPRRGPRRRARRGDGLREPVGRNVPARRVLLADRGDHARPRARLAGAGRTRQDAVLEGRPRRAGRSSSAARSATLVRDAAAAAAGRRGRAPDARPRSRRAWRPRTSCSTSPTRWRPRGAVPTPHDPDRARAATSSATGASACSRRSAAASTRRGRWRRRRRSARSAASTSRRMWTDDGFVVRFPDVDEPPDVAAAPAGSGRGARRWSSGSSARTALFAAKFRENAARALLLPRRRPGMRAPLWQQRKRAADLLAVALELRIVPDAARNLPRVPARRLRHAGAGRHAAPTSAARTHPRRDRRFGAAVAVRRVAALRLRRQLPLRRRRAARRAPRAGARGRPGAAARAARRRRAARAARRRRPCDARRARSCSGSTRRYHAKSAGRRARPAARARRPDARTRSRRARRRADVAAAMPATRARRAASLDGARRRRSRATSPSKTRRATATRSACRCPPGLPESLLDAASRSARRPGATLRAHARAVHRRRRSRPATASAGASPKTRSCALAADGQLRRRRVHAGRHRVASGPMPVCCVSCGGGRSRNSATRSSRSSSRVLGRFDDDLAGRRPAPARRGRAARRDRAAPGRAAARVDPRNRDPSGPDRRATIPRTSTP